MAERRPPSPQQHSKKAKNDSITISLLDTIAFRKIRTPVTGEKCSHPQLCFDKESFLNHPGSDTKNCPVCNQPCNEKTLITDSLIQEIINQTGEEVLAIILHEDNTWTATEEQEDEVAVISCMLNNLFQELQMIRMTTKLKYQVLPFRLQPPLLQPLPPWVFFHSNNHDKRRQLCRSV